MNKPVAERDGEQVDECLATNSVANYPAISPTGVAIRTAISPSHLRPSLLDEAPQNIQKQTSNAGPPYIAPQEQTFLYATLTPFFT